MLLIKDIKGKGCKYNIVIVKKVYNIPFTHLKHEYKESQRGSSNRSAASGSGAVYRVCTAGSRRMKRSLRLLLREPVIK